MHVSRRETLAGLSGAIGLNALHPLAAQNVSGGRLKALVIGIDRYGSLKNLERAVLDAESIAERLAGIGYDVTLARNSDTDALFQEYDNFVAGLTNEDAVFVYFAGHGVQYNGVNYLIPADADATEEDMLLATSIPLPAFLEGIAGANPLQSIAVIDACRNEPLEINITGATDGFASTTAPAGFFVAYSAGTGQFAIDRLGDDDCHRNGLFTRSFLDHLRPETPISDIIKLTRTEVSAAALQINRRQNPAFYDQSYFEYRLDGVKGRRGATPNISLSGLEGTVALVVAVQDYADFSDIPSLATPREDARRIAGSFSEMGAEAVVLNGPTKNELLTACRRISEMKCKQVITYFAGMGGLVAEDAQMFLRSEKPGLEISNLPAGLDMVSAYEIAAALTRVGDTTEASVSGSTRGLKYVARKRHDQLTMDQTEQVPIMMFFDACLDQLEIDIPGPKNPSLLKLLNKSAFGHVGFLSAAGYFQLAYDAAPGESSSPFAIALSNAFARPDLNIRQYSQQIRAEVEALTGGRQTPRLFLGNKIKNLVPVIREIDEAKAMNCS